MSAIYTPAHIQATATAQIGTWPFQCCWSFFVNACAYLSNQTVFYAIAFIKVFLSIALVIFRPNDEKRTNERNKNLQKKNDTHRVLWDINVPRNIEWKKKYHKIKINMTVVDCTYYPYQVITSISFLFFQFFFWCHVFHRFSFLLLRSLFSVEITFLWWLLKQTRLLA